jgi:hypothetical protein
MLLFDDCAPVINEGSIPDSQEIDFLMENTGIDKYPGPNEQPGFRVDKPKCATILLRLL